MNFLAYKHGSFISAKCMELHTRCWAENLRPLSILPNSEFQRVSAIHTQGLLDFLHRSPTPPYPQFWGILKFKSPISGGFATDHTE